jgi:signal transduction histidine kinase
LLGDALGVLAVASPILALAYAPPVEPRARPIEIAATATAASAVIVVPAVLWQVPLLFLVLPVLIWAALRGGARMASVAGCAVAFSIAWAGATDRAENLFGTGNDQSHLVYMQLFLLVTLLAAMTLAVEVTERLRAENTSRRAMTARARAEVAAVKAASNERRRIVRETHDIVGHAMNVMLLQAGAARRVLARDPDKTRELLVSLEETGRDAFRDLDVALGLVDHKPALQPAQGLASVPELVDGMRRGGLQIELRVTGDAVELPTLVDWSAYRILQEAVTNVAKHAPGGRAVVTIDYRANDLSLSVTNDGWAPAASSEHRTGRGLAGVRERVAVLGGEIDAGPSGDDRFALQVRLPVNTTRR